MLVLAASTVNHSTCFLIRRKKDSTNTTGPAPREYLESLPRVMKLVGTQKSPPKSGRIPSLMAMGRPAGRAFESLWDLLSHSRLPSMLSRQRELWLSRCHQPASRHHACERHACFRGAHDARATRGQASHKRRLECRPNNYHSRTIQQTSRAASGAFSSIARTLSGVHLHISSHARNSGAAQCWPRE